MRRFSLSKSALVAVLLSLAFVVTACGSSSSSSSGNAGGSTASSSGSGGANVAAATAAVQQYTAKPTPFPVDQPLKTRPTGQTYGYLQCSTPVCGLFSQLLGPTQSLLGYKLNIVKAGASAAELQAAMDSIISEKPNGILLTAITPNQFANQLKTAVQEKIPMTVNGVMHPETYGFGAAVFDQRLTLLSGKLLADWVISRHGSKSNAVLYTIPELDFTSYIEKGYQQEMARLCPSCVNRYVPIPVATVGNTAPSRVVADLQANPNTKTVVFASGETGTGVPAALKSAGLNVDTTGYAPNPVVTEYVKTGQFTSALGLDIGVMIWTQLDELARLSTHQPLTAGEVAGDVPIQFLSEQNLRNQDVSKGWASYPDWTQRFAKLWAGK